MGIKTQLINHVLEKNYYLAKLSTHVWFYLKSGGKQPLIIYQMGKVGSTSIMYSLQGSNLDMPVYQVHALSEPGIIRMEKMYYGETSKVFRKSLLPETKHIFTSYFLRAQLHKDLTQKRWKVITLVRDPIARNVSEYFYSVDTTKHDPHLPDFYERYQSNAISTEELIERFLERFHENSEDYNLPLRWFDTEFKPVLGVDVFSRDFPMAKGYQIFHGEFADVLLLKLERIRECFFEAFSEFLNLRDLHLGSSNAASQKHYYPAYKNFRNLVNLPASYVHNIYDSKYMRHFYTEEEIDNFRKEWHKQ